MLFQIAEVLPREQQGLMACCHPVPPLLRQYLNEVHKIILEARELSLTQVDVVKSDTVISLPNNTIDLDNILHCPHDVVHENDSNLPTLLSCLDESTFLPEIPPISGDIRLVNSTKLSATVFERSSEVRNCDSKSTSLNFISPYQRYKMAKPDYPPHSTNDQSATKAQSTSNNKRIQNLFKHLEDLQSQEDSKEKSPATIHDDDESTNIQKKVEESKETMELVDEENKSDSEIEVVAEVKKGRKRKRKRNRTKVHTNLSLNVDEADTKPFTPYDYSKAENILKSTPAKRMSISEKSGRSSSTSKPRKKKMKKQKTIFASQSTSARSWPKK
ncbi:exosome component 10-like [Centruroides sculpturatus]|uniref:exosome component 10-like n=1 Tax=Centruroides sculpturatus TaxID=218467 RepID=UPI000C6D083A|nr:exosome component 10-like [Centruroides sculpturatus]